MKWELLEITGNILFDFWLTVSNASKSLINYVILAMIFIPIFYKLSRTTDDTGLSFLKSGWLVFLPTLSLYYFSVWIQSNYNTAIKLLHGEFIILYVALLALGTGLLYYDRSEN